MSEINAENGSATQDGSATEYEGQTEGAHDDCEVHVAFLEGDDIELSEEEREVLNRVAMRMGAKAIVEHRAKRKALNESAYKLIEARLRNDPDVGAQQMELMLEDRDTVQKAIMNLTDISCALISRLYTDAQSNEELADSFVRQVTEEREAQARAEAESDEIDLREKDEATA